MSGMKQKRERHILLESSEVNIYPTTRKAVIEIWYIEHCTSGRFCVYRANEAEKHYCWTLTEALDMRAMVVQELTEPKTRLIASGQ